MLIWADTEKEIFEIPKSRRKFFENGKSKLSDYEYEFLKDYINQLIDNVVADKNEGKKFFVPGWQAPGSWEGTPLNVIWEKILPNDADGCALWYGLLVMEILIDRCQIGEEWRAIKTNYNRNFDQMTYWIEEKSEFAIK